MTAVVVDTSAIFAIMEDEPERRHFNEIIQDAESTHMSAATLLECRIVLFARRGQNAVWALDAFVRKSGMTIEDVTPAQTDFAFSAYRRFGKGLGQGASLNFGDCFSYALAKHLDAPLLFKGADFSKTDIVAVTA